MMPACVHHSVSACIADMMSDVRTYMDRSADYNGGGRSFIKYVSAFLTPQLVCICLYRLSHFFFCRNFRRIAQVVAYGNQYLHKAFFDPGSCIGGGLYLPHPAAVVFSGKAGRNLTLYAGAVCMLHVQGRCRGATAPTLGDHVSVGSRAVIVEPVMVGSRTSIGFGAVVTKDIPENSAAIPVSRMITIREEQAGWTRRYSL